MNMPNITKMPKFDYLILLSIIALAFCIAFIPHQNYPYPVHINEWVHLAYSKAMLKASSTTFLTENGISLLYTRSPCQNPDLTEVRKNIYLLKEAQNGK